MLREGKGSQDWTRGTRWQDFVLALQWLHEWHIDQARGSPEVLKLLYDTMVRMKAVSTDWRSVFSEELFPKQAVTEWKIYWHGVNLAEGLKAMAVGCRFTKDKSELSDAIAAWNRIHQYHGRPSGVFAAVAERVERQAYNTLPATLTGDMWAHQYVQQQNQIAARNMTPNPFPSDGPDSNVFGLEPNYPCCTVNHMQGFPKFVAAAFVTNPDRTTLFQVYRGPFQVQTTLANDSEIHARVNTTYPFGDTMEVHINATKPFEYYLRMPQWALGKNTVTIKGASLGDMPTTIQSQSIKVNIDPGGSVFRVVFNPLYGLSLVLETRSRYTGQTSEQVDSPAFDWGGPPTSLQVTACLVKRETAGETFADAPPENPDDEEEYQFSYSMMRHAN
ncbi:hypothetical protein FRC09_007378 [Ceratobasidium sp. 395]|nr:hypothetical protein FRC09_007378 [Ceratobasidium sp. 395]